MSEGGGRRTPWVLTALIWWTFVGTCISAVGLFTDVPKTGLLWPTEISPHWLGAVIGAIVFIVLVAVQGATGQEKRHTEDQRPV